MSQGWKKAKKKPAKISLLPLCVASPISLTYITFLFFFFHFLLCSFPVYSIIFFPALYFTDIGYILLYTARPARYRRLGYCRRFSSPPTSLAKWYFRGDNFYFFFFQLDEHWKNQKYWRLPRGEVQEGNLGLFKENSCFNIRNTNSFLYFLYFLPNPKGCVFYSYFNDILPLFIFILRLIWRMKAKQRKKRRLLLFRKWLNKRKDAVIIVIKGNPTMYNILYIVAICCDTQLLFIAHFWVVNF